VAGLWKRLFTDAPRPVQALDLIVAGSAAVLVIGVALGIASLPPRPTDPTWWWLLLYALLFAGAAIFGWGVISFATSMVGGGAQGIRVVRDRASRLPRVRIVVERRGIAATSTTPGEVTQSPRYSGPSLLNELAAEDREAWQETLEEDTYFSGIDHGAASTSDEAPDGPAGREWGAGDVEIIPEGAQHFRGLPVLRCPWCGYGTTDERELAAHNASHTEPPPGLEKRWYEEPQPWAKAPVHFVGVGGHYLTGVPADGTKTLYVARDYADELVRSGLYEHGAVPADLKHAVSSLGPPIHCVCGYETLAGTEMARHMTDARRGALERPPLALGLSTEGWANKEPEFCQRRHVILATGNALLDRLRRISDYGPPDAELEWEQPVREWIAQFHAFTDIYWGTEQRTAVDSEAMADGERHENSALPPNWRKRNVGQVGARVAWLRERGYGCPD
jgi:hypothetical protein